MLPGYRTKSGDSITYQYYKHFFEKNCTQNSREQKLSCSAVQHVPLLFMQLTGQMQICIMNMCDVTCGDTNLKGSDSSGPVYFLFCAQELVIIIYNICLNIHTSS